jgi:tight adherence protein C
MQFLLFLAIGFTIFCAAALFFAPMLIRATPEEQRILTLVTSTRADRRTVKGKEKLQERILELARGLRRRIGLAENPALKLRFLHAGIRGRSSIDIFLTLQMVNPIIGAFLGSFIPNNTIFWVLALAGVGYMSPDFWLTRKTKKRRDAIRRGIPDALDMLVICVDAGLGLDQALQRVGVQLAHSHPEINEEFTQINLEQRAGKPRLEAWQSVADRTQIEEFKSFVNMLMQTDRFGTPILKALTQFSEEIRLKRTQRAEEAAAKTKVKIIFPLVLFIFPAIFIVLLAPALMSIASGLKVMGN